MLKPEKIIEISRKYTFSTGEISSDSQSCRGSDWCLEVSIQGPLDPKTQLVFNLIDLDGIVLPILEKIDKKNLNNLIENSQDLYIGPDDLCEHLFHKINFDLKSRHKNLQLVKTKAYRMGSNEWGSYANPCNKNH